MGLSLAYLLSASKEILKCRLFGLSENVDTVMVRSISFGSDDHREEITRTVSFKGEDSDSDSIYDDYSSDSPNKLVVEESVSFKEWAPEKLAFQTNFSFKNLVLDREILAKSKEDQTWIQNSNPEKSLPEPAILYSPRPVSELNDAALKVQKFYRSYRTRRNLADCAVVIEELWWKALDFAALKRSSVSFFDNEKPESAVSRWARARTRVAKVGKGLSKDEKAQKLALRHWLEAIDPRHRYGHNLHFYYDVWFVSQSSQPFFYWLDIGDGKEVNLEKCPRTNLQHQCIRYLGPKEREAYEITIESGKLIYRQSGLFVDTIEGSKWIFVLSTSRNLYIGQKKKGLFQHSSFLAGGATTAAGRLVAHNGILEAIWPYSGHYHPTEENFLEFISFLEENHVDLSHVKKYAIDDDDPLLKVTFDEEPKSDSVRGQPSDNMPCTNKESADTTNITTATIHQKDIVDTSRDKVKGSALELCKRVSSKWTTGAGPRIGCVREYPADLQSQALEQVHLSPRVLTPGSFASCGPIPSPRPSPKFHLSPRLTNMGLPSPRVLVHTAN